MRASSAAIASCLAVVLGVACGGGPGDATYNNVFEVVERSPVQGDGNVRVGVPFTARFSRPLDPSTVVDGNVQVSGNGGVPLAKTLSLSDDKQTLTIKLLAAPTLPATVTVAFQGLRDILGGAAPQDQWSFSMPDWWEPFGTPPVSDPGPVVLDGAGNPVVVSCGGGGVQVVRWSAGAWTPMGQTLSHGGTHGCPPSVAYASVTSGTTFADAFAVAWEEADSISTTANHKTYVAVWNGTEWRDPSGGAIASAGSAASVTGAYMMSPALAFDTNGALYLTALSGLTVQAWRWPAGGTAWTALGVLNKTASYQASGASMMHDSGGALVAWTERQSFSTPTDAFATSFSGDTGTRLAAGGKLNATGRSVVGQPVFVANSMNPRVVFQDRDTTAGTYGVQVVQATSTRLSSVCTGQLIDDATQPADGLAAASGSDGTWVALAQAGQLRVKSCDLNGVRLVGTPAAANASVPLFLGFIGTGSVPTVAYFDLGPPVPRGTTPDRHVRIKQPNR